MSFLEGVQMAEGRTQPFRVLLKRGVVRKDKYLFKWVNKFPPERRTVQVALMDEDGVPKVKWKIEGATPIRLEAPEFKADGNDVAIECLEIIADRMTIKFY